MFKKFVFDSEQFVTKNQSSNASSWNIKFDSSLILRSVMVIILFQSELRGPAKIDSRQPPLPSPKHNPL